MYQLMEAEGRECYCVSVPVELFSSVKTTISERVHIRSLGKMGKMFLFNPQDGADSFCNSAFAVLNICTST
jgi:hypothetical protein